MGYSFAAFADFPEGCKQYGGEISLDDPFSLSSPYGVCHLRVGWKVWEGKNKFFQCNLQRS